MKISGDTVNETFLICVSMVLSSMGLQGRPTYPFTVSGAFGLSWNLLGEACFFQESGLTGKCAHVPLLALILRWEALLRLALLVRSVYSSWLPAVDPGSMALKPSDVLISTHTL